MAGYPLLCSVAVGCGKVARSEAILSGVPLSPDVLRSNAEWIGA